MFNKMRRRVILLLVMVTMVLVGCGQLGNIVDVNYTESPIKTEDAIKTPVPSDEDDGTGTPVPDETPLEPIETPDNTQTEQPKENTVDSEFEVHFIDCGQGDSILLKSDGKTMLIDAANNQDGKAIVTYLKNQKIEKLDYVVGTHPDADHIGGLDVVIDAFEVGKVYLPKKQNNTKTFEDLLIAISSKGLKISSPKPGTKISLGSASLTIVAPINYYDDDNNNNSIVIRAVHGDNSFLLTGDAGLQEETDMMDAGENLQATVLKVGHHGSNSSTSRFFLEAVKPTYAVISCGVDNKYGHPHKETMDYLNMYGIEVYRTDLQQTIIMKSDGKKLDISTGNPSAMGSGSSSSSSSKEDTTTVKESTNDNSASSTASTYIGNKNSKVFHRPTCNSLPAEKNRVELSSREEAVNSGYKACGRCQP